MNSKTILVTADIVRSIQNKSIADIEFEIDDDADPSMVEIKTITLEDGTVLNFQGSGQIGMDMVWMHIDKPEKQTGIDFHA